MAVTAPPPTNGRPAAVDIKPGQLFINGRWRDAQGGKNMPTSSPTTEEVITTIATASPADINEAIDAANVAFPKWAKLHGYVRAKIMNRIADLIDEHAHELAYREAVDMGKLYSDVMMVDVPHIANMFRYYTGWCGLASGIQTADYRKAMKFAEHIKAGTV